MDLELPLTILGAAAGLSTILGVTLTRMKRQRDWITFGQSHHLRLHRSAGLQVELRGSYRGVQIAMGITSQSFLGQRQNSYNTFIEVMLNSRIPGHFHVSTETLVRKVGKAVMHHDIQIGVDSFDKLFLIQGDHEELIRRLLRSAHVRQPILGIHQLHAKFNLDNERVRLDMRGVSSLNHTLSLLHQLIPLTAELAQAIHATLPGHLEDLHFTTQDASKPW